MAEQNHSHGWRAYWQGALASGDALAGGAKGTALDDFWAAFLERRIPGAVRALDVCCGAGAVARRIADKASDRAEFSLFCADYSGEAAGQAAQTCAAQSENPAHGFAADAGLMPVVDGGFDIVASQFGLEYAGTAAFSEAARVLAPGGAFAALVHLKGGPIEAECACNLALVEAAQKTGLIETARHAFDAGYSADVGGGADGFRLANNEFAAAVARAKKVIVESPPGEAHSFFMRFFKDLGEMYPNRRAYDPQEVQFWLDNGARELSAYHVRMASMVSAAKGKDEIKDIAAQLNAAGLDIASPATLAMGEPATPAAWILTGEKRAG